MESILQLQQDGRFMPFNVVMTEEILKEFKAGELYHVEIRPLTPAKLRTLPQNSAIHLYCSKLGAAFNDAGYDMKLVFSRMNEKCFLSWSMILVKESIWKVIQKALFKTESTTQLKTGQVTDVYEHIDRFTAEQLGISIPFPSYEAQLNESQSH